MAKYSVADEDGDGNESGYESDGGTEYVPKSKIGQGNYSSVRKFQSHDGLKSVAVLKPVDPDDVHQDEAAVKMRFFRNIYTKMQMHLYLHKESYRLVLPFIPGTQYKKFKIEQRVDQIRFFISAINALKDCHQKGYVVIDLSENNIHFDVETSKSYLVDGGLSVAMNKEGFVPELFCRGSLREIEYCTKKYPHIAPECWSLNRVKAQPEMDIYSLGYMMRQIIPLLEPDLAMLCSACLHDDPQKRPTLEQLEEFLLVPLSSKTYTGLNSSIQDMNNGGLFLSIIQKVEKQFLREQLQRFDDNVLPKGFIANSVLNSFDEQKLLYEVAAHVFFSSVKKRKLKDLCLSSNILVKQLDGKLFISDHERKEYWSINKQKCMSAIGCLLGYLNNSPSIYCHFEEVSKLFNVKFNLDEPLESFISIKKKLIAELTIFEQKFEKDNPLLYSALKSIEEVHGSLSLKAYEALKTNDKLQAAIIQFNTGCAQLDFGDSIKKKEALRLYQVETIQLALQGEAAFREGYAFVEKKAVRIIDDDSFKIVVRTLANVLLTVLAAITVVGLIAMAATSKQRGGFFLLSNSHRELTINAMNFEELFQETKESVLRL